MAHLGSSRQTITGLSHTAINNKLVDLQGSHGVFALLLVHLRCLKCSVKYSVRCWPPHVFRHSTGQRLFSPANATNATGQRYKCNRPTLKCNRPTLQVQPANVIASRPRNADRLRFIPGKLLASLEPFCGSRSLGHGALRCSSFSAHTGFQP